MSTLARGAVSPNFNLLTNLSKISVNDLYIIDGNNEVNLKDYFVLKTTFDAFLNTYSNDYDYLIHLHNKQNVEINGGTLTDDFIQNYTKNGKADKFHQHEIQDVNQLEQQLNSKRVKTDFNFKNVANLKVDTFDITYVDENNQVLSLRDSLQKLVDAIFGKDSPLSDFQELYDLWNTFTGGSNNPSYNWNNYFNHSTLSNGLVYGLIAFLQAEISAKIATLTDTQDTQYFIPANDKYYRKGGLSQHVNSLIKANNRTFISIYPIYNRLCFKNDLLKTLEYDGTGENPYPNILTHLQPIVNFRNAVIFDNTPLEFMNNASIRINNTEVFKIQSGEYYWNDDVYTNLSIPRNNYQKDLLTLSDTSTIFYNRVYDRSGKKYVLEDEIGGQQPLKITNYINDEIYFTDNTKRYITVNNNLQETYQSNYQVVQQQKHYMFFNYDSFLDDSFLLNPVKQNIQNINNAITNINTAITNLQNADNSINTELGDMNSQIDLQATTLELLDDRTINNTNNITNNTNAINAINNNIRNLKPYYFLNEDNTIYNDITKNISNINYFTDELNYNSTTKKYITNATYNNEENIYNNNLKKYITNATYNNEDNVYNNIVKKYSNSVSYNNEEYTYNTNKQNNLIINDTNNLVINTTKSFNNIILNNEDVIYNSTIKTTYVFGGDNSGGDSFVFDSSYQINNVKHSINNINTAITTLQNADNSIHTELGDMNSQIDLHATTLELLDDRITNNTNAISNINTVISNTKRVYENNYQNEEYIYDTKNTYNNTTVFNDNIDESINEKNYITNVFNNTNTEILTTNKVINNNVFEGENNLYNINNTYKLDKSIDYRFDEKYEYDFSYQLKKIRDDAIEVGHELDNIKLNINSIQTINNNQQTNINGLNLDISGCLTRLDVIESDVALLQSLFTTYQSNNITKYNYFNIVGYAPADLSYLPLYYNSETALNWETTSTITNSNIELVVSNNITMISLTKAGFYEFKLKLDTMKYTANSTKSSGSITVYM